MIPMENHRGARLMQKTALTCAVFFCLSAFMLSAQVIDKPVATIRLTKMQVITATQLRNLFAPVIAQTRRDLTDDEKGQYLDQLVARALVEQAAERDGVSVSDAELKSRLNGYRATFASSRNLGRDMTDSEMQSYVASMGMSWSEFEGQARYEVLRLAYIRLKKKPVMDAVKAPADADAQDYYDYHKKDFATDDMIRVKHIFIDTRGITAQADTDLAMSRAKEILKQLDAGASFEDVQMRNSEDAAAKYKGGDLGVIDRLDQQRQQQFGRQFIDSLFKLQKGERSGILTSKVGLHIVLVTERYDAKLLGFTDLIPPAFQSTVKDYIKQMLTVQWQNDAFAMAFGEIVTDLKKQAEVRVFKENIP
jgi:peptidyl-prolyl cis-trans isomerase SurA